MDDSNEKLLILAQERDRKRLEFEYLLKFSRAIRLPGDWRKESYSEQAVTTRAYSR